MYVDSVAAEEPSQSLRIYHRNSVTLYHALILPKHILRAQVEAAQMPTRNIEDKFSAVQQVQYYHPIPHPCHTFL